MNSGGNPFGGLRAAFFTGPPGDYVHRGGGDTRKTADFSHLMRAAATG